MRRLAVVLAATLLACGNEYPEFTSVLVPQDTTDTRGPYAIETYVSSSHDIVEVSAFVAASQDGDAVELGGARTTVASGDAELWKIEIPGRPVGTDLFLYLVALDEKGRKSSYPAGAPQDRLHFRVIGTF